VNIYSKVGSLLTKAATGAIIATGIAISQAGSWGTGLARASTHQVTLQYSCTFPIIGAVPITGVVSWDFPDAVTVGKPTLPAPFTVTAQVPSSYVEAAHRFLGIASASGSGEGSVMVIAPQGDIPLSIPASVPSTSVPATGPITLVITSTFPSLTPTQPGVAKVRLGTITIHITPRDADGNVTFLGTVNSTCTPDPGQNNLMASVLINPAPRIAEPAPHPTPVKSSRTPYRSTLPPSASTLPPSPSPTHYAPAPTHTLPAPLPDPGPSGKDIAIISGSALAVAAGAAGLRLLLRWRTRHRL